MKLRIISDGTSRGTRIEHAETGEILERVISAEWRIIGRGEATITLEIERVELNVIGEAMRVTGFPTMAKEQP